MTRHRILISTLVSAAAGLAAAGLIAGCSSDSGATTAVAAASSGTGNAAYTAYASCLSQHGVKLPSGAAGFGGRRSHSPGASFSPRAVRSGGYPVGVGGFASANPTMSAAMQACASLRPTGAAGFGGAGGFGGGSTRLVAFRNCMTQQGEAVPTTRPTAATARPTGDARYLNGLNPADPKVAAALKVCEPLIPTASASPAATSTS
ncbi:MAG TPA: hypothetical protein VL551_34785 [Actinospica sp.]|jgi:hypothetical protein|nr:hypothetical protein [Actinospica sp.]